MDKPGLCCVSVWERLCMRRRQHDRPYVRIVTTIGSACGQGLHPHLFVRQAMCTHNGGCGELVAQLLHVSHCGKFQVHNGDIGPVSGNGISQFIDTTHHIHRPEMVVQRPRQRLTSLAVALRDNYTERFHD